MVLVSWIFPVVTWDIIFVLVPFQYFYGICCVDLDILAHPCLYPDGPIIGQAFLFFVVFSIVEVF
jgi:hypothetical protein